MLIDAHVQFWKDEKGKQDYLPEHFSLTAKRNEIDGVVAVAANQKEVETRFLVELSKTHPIIKGVVGWTDLKDEHVGEKLTFFSQHPVIKAWCHDFQDEPDILQEADFQRGISQLQAFNYTFELLIDHDQLPVIVQFFSMFPELDCVIDHCAKPDIRHKEMDEWKFMIKEIAKHPKAYCKVSGLFTQAASKQWSPADFYPYLDVVFDAFGTDRLMYGSDWPVLLQSGIYVQWKSLLQKYMESSEPEEIDRVFGLNAVDFYDLGSQLLENS